MLYNEGYIVTYFLFIESLFGSCEEKKHHFFRSMRSIYKGLSGFFPSFLAAICRCLEHEAFSCFRKYAIIIEDCAEGRGE